MDLHKKLEALKQKQLVIEAQINEQSAEENRIVAAAFSALIGDSPNALAAARSAKVTNGFSARDSKTYTTWLDRSFGIPQQDVSVAPNDARDIN